MNAARTTPARKPRARAGGRAAAPRPRAAAPKPSPKPSREAPAAPPPLAADEDDVYDRIRSAILDHRLNPGTKLKEVALAEVFGVNRSVVRKALARLAFARLIDQKPNRGATVASPTVAESCDLLAARRAVEAAIVDTAARRAEPAQAKALRALVAQEREAYRSGELRKGLQLSLRFHHELAAAAGNAVLAEFLDQLVARMPLVVLAYRTRGSASRCGDDEHAGIVDAIAASDPARAVAAMNAHLDTLESQLDLSAPSAPVEDLASVFAATAPRATAA